MFNKNGSFGNRHPRLVRAFIRLVTPDRTLRRNDTLGGPLPPRTPSVVSQFFSRLRSRVTGCAVKGGGPQRELNPPGNWFAPPGSNQSSSGGNETAEASGAESR